MALADLSRHDIRYWCFRFRTADAGGAPAKGAPAGLRKRFEAHEHFGGWERFGVTWDVAQGDPWVIVPLRYSLEQQWNSEAWANARPLPPALSARDREVPDGSEVHD